MIQLAACRNVCLCVAKMYADNCTIELFKCLVNIIVDLLLYYVIYFKIIFELVLTV